MTTQPPSAAETAGRHYAYLRTKVAAAAAANDGVALEDHLRAPVQALVESVAEDLGYPEVVLAGEIPGAVAGARPDYTEMRGGLVIGHIELKAPGAGVDPAVESLLSLLAATDPALLNDAGDWLYFYEDFLAQYDPGLSKDSGSYYTPAELVQFMVRVVDEVLRTRLGQPSGFAEESVTVIDPAVGTGTFLLQIIDRIASTVTERDGAGAVAGALRGAAERLVGFELQTGPYSVAQFRTGARFRRHGVDRAPRVLLADTLADPYTEEVRLGSIYEPISRERRAANHLKATTPVMVAIGNPPYRERAKGLGGWVESGNPNTDLPPILDDWKPPSDWGVSAHIYNMSNLLVYFWRWATWKVLEDAGNDGGESPGVVCFVTTAAWLSGDGFQQMRAWLRQQSSEIWVVSLSPEGHQRHQVLVQLPEGRNGYPRPGLAGVDHT